MAQKRHCAQNSKYYRKSMSLQLAACVAGGNSPDAYASDLFKPSKASGSL